MEIKWYSSQNLYTDLLECYLMVETIKSKKDMMMSIYLRRIVPGPLYASRAINKDCAAIIATISVPKDLMKVTLLFDGFSPQRKTTS